MHDAPPGKRGSVSSDATAAVCDPLDPRSPDSPAAGAVHHIRFTWDARHQCVKAALINEMRLRPPGDTTNGDRTRRRKKKMNKKK